MKKILVTALLFLLLLPDFANAIGLTVTTLPATNITGSTATLNGSHSISGVSTRGFAWGTLSKLSGGDTATTTESGSFSAGSFSASATGLSPSTAYYVRAYVIASGVTSFGTIVLFRAKGALSSPPNNLGLVGYWSFDEGTGTVATDFSGNGNHGTLGTNPATPTWTNGKRGVALDFDATDDTVTAANSTSLDVTGALTMTAWVKFDDLDGTPVYHDVMGKIVSSYTQYALATENDELLFGFCHGVPNTCGTFNYMVTTATNLQAGVWYHIASTYTDSGNDIIIYVNGVAQTTTIGDGDPENRSIQSSTGSVIHGEAVNGEFTDGVIDEVRLYNRALSESEIVALYGSGAGQFIASSQSLTAGTTLGASGGLIGHWTFDGYDFIDRVTDASGNGNHGYVYGVGTTTIKDEGKLGQGARFNGSGVSYIDAGSASMLDNLTTMSVCAWVNRTGLATNYGDLVSKGTNGGGGWGLYTLANFEALGFQGPLDTVEYGGGGQFPTGTWVHVCATWDGGTSAGSILLYRNGAPTGQIFYESGSSFNDSAINLKIGGNPSGVNPVSAVMDDVRLYNRALSATEVKQLYNVGKAVVSP